MSNWLQILSAFDITVFNSCETTLSLIWCIRSRPLLPGSMSHPSVVVWGCMRQMKHGSMAAPILAPLMRANSSPDAELKLHHAKCVRVTEPLNMVLFSSGRITQWWRHSGEYSSAVRPGRKVCFRKRAVNWNEIYEMWGDKGTSRRWAIAHLNLTQVVWTAWAPASGSVVCRGCVSSCAQFHPPP